MMTGGDLDNKICDVGSTVNDADRTVNDVGSIDKIRRLYDCFQFRTYAFLYHSTVLIYFRPTRIIDNGTPINSGVERFAILLCFFKFPKKGSLFLFHGFRLPYCIMILEF